MNNYYVESHFTNNVSNKYPKYDYMSDVKDSVLQRDFSDEDGIKFNLNFNQIYRRSSMAVLIQTNSGGSGVPSIHLPEVDVNPRLSECLLHFDGMEGNKQLKDFIFKIDWYKKIYCIPDNEAIEDLGEVFSGFAREWWNNTSAKPKKWKKVKSLLKKTFGRKPVYTKRSINCSDKY